LQIKDQKIESGFYDFDEETLVPVRRRSAVA
jgi:hypothetical protein